MSVNDAWSLFCRLFAGGTPIFRGALSPVEIKACSAVEPAIKGTVVNRTSEQVSDLNRRIAQIERSMDLDGVAKAAAIEPLLRRRDQITKSVVDRARSIGAF